MSFNNTQFEKFEKHLPTAATGSFPHSTQRHFACMMCSAALYTCYTASRYLKSPECVFICVPAHHYHHAALHRSYFLILIIIISYGRIAK